MRAASAVQDHTKNTKEAKLTKSSSSQAGALVLFAVFVFFVLEKQCLRRGRVGRLSHPPTQSCLGPGVRRDEREWGYYGDAIRNGRLALVQLGRFAQCDGSATRYLFLPGSGRPPKSRSSRRLRSRGAQQPKPGPRQRLGPCAHDRGIGIGVDELPWSPSSKKIAARRLPRWLT